MRRSHTGYRTDENYAEPTAESTLIILCLLQIQNHGLAYYKHTNISSIEPVGTVIPDSIFPCATNGDCHVTKQRVDEMLRSSRVVIAGTIRDKEEHIRNIRPIVENLANQFQESAILIVENDSEDDTRGKLLEWARDNDRVKILGCGVNNVSCNMNMEKTIGHPKTYSRIEKMATIRNVYIDYLKSDYADWDYLIVWDIDIEGVMFMEGLYHTLLQFQENDQIDGICSFGIRPNYLFGWNYYDPFAHEELDGDPSWIWHDAYIKWRLHNMPRGIPLHPVRSCFGGMTTYKISSIVSTDTAYDYSRDTSEPIICEHVFFNEPLKMYSNPSQIYAVLHN